MTDVLTLPPTSGEWVTPNGVATITRQERAHKTDGDMIVVEYRTARVHIFRRGHGTWSIRVMNIGTAYTDSAPKATSEAEVIARAIKDVDRTLRIHEEARTRNGRR